MKKSLFLAAFCTFLLASVLLVNTLRFTSRQIRVEPAAPLALDENLVARRLADAIRFQTISRQDATRGEGEAFVAFHACLERTYPKVHATLVREIVNGGSLLYTWAGSDKTLKPLLLMAHQDVVPVEAGSESGWHHPPFGGVIYGGSVWGRGTMDNKSGVLGILEAVELLVRQGFQPRRTVYLAFGHDEEAGGRNGAAKIAELLAARRVELESLLDEGMIIAEGILPLPQPVALVGIAEKGYLSIELSVEVSGGHSSMPPARTAIGVLSAAVARLEDRQMPCALTGAVGQMFDAIGPEMTFGKRLVFANLWLFKPLAVRQLATSTAMNAALRTTAATTIIAGGDKENSLPSKARAVVNFRIRPGDSIDRVMTHVRAAISDTRVAIRRCGEAVEPSRVSDITHPSYRRLQRTIRQVFPDVLVSPAQVVAGTDARHYERLTDNIFHFFPQRYRPDDVDRPHGANERISVSDYAQCVRFYHQLILNAAGAP